MPVDNAELTKMIQLAHLKLKTVKAEQNKLSDFIENCASILETPNVENPESMNEIKDPNLGKKMSVARRQAIYDVILVDKSTLDL